VSISTKAVYRLCVYVPTAHSDAVKQALFAAGAGRIGNYDCCSWECAGTGQFRPMTGSDPFVGKMGCVERVAEMKIELVCAGAFLEEALAALRAAHPYETPAYQYWPVEGVVG